jgi:hypothetical protein
MKEKRSRKELSQKSVPKNPNKGVLCPKIDTAERRRQSGKNPRLGKSLNFKGTVSFLHIRGIKRYFPTAPFCCGSPKQVMMPPGKQKR